MPKYKNAAADLKTEIEALRTDLNTEIRRADTAEELLRQCVKHNLLKDFVLRYDENGNIIKTEMP